MSKENFFPEKAYEKTLKDTESLGAMELFGNRIFADQSVLEILNEFLLIVFSEKTIGKIENEDNFFPKLDKDFNEIIQYSNNFKLTLKLFSLYSSSSNSVSPPSHENYYNKIKKELSDSISIVNPSMNIDNEKILAVLENLFKGFQGVGANRDWCAQSFIPLRKEFLAGETIWKATEAKKEAPKETSINKTEKYFAHTGHNIYAKAGEVLYLEVLLALSQSEEDVKRLADGYFKGIHFTSEELKPEELRKKLERGFSKLFQNDKSPEILGRIANFINNIDSENDIKDFPKKLSLGWIPKNNWKFGYLFAVEVSRIFNNYYDIIEEISILQIAVVLHNIRRFTFVSSEFLNRPKSVIAVINSNCKSRIMKEISRTSYKECQLVIKNALELKVKNKEELQKISKKYGQGTMVRWAKAIDFVVPKTGSTEKFVLTNNILACLIATTIVPGEKTTLDTFLTQLKLRYGMIFDTESFNRANQEFGKRQRIQGFDTMDWFKNMLEESGYLIQLSDFVSLVQNFDNSSEGRC
ncbi:MAG: hypothetical protein WC162_00140 [Sphaerochaetaceae bacterium]